MQRSDKTVALSSNFNFASGSQCISGPLFLVLSHQNEVLLQTRVQITLVVLSNFFLDAYYHRSLKIYLKPHITEIH